MRRGATVLALLIVLAACDRAGDPDAASGPASEEDAPTPTDEPEHAIEEPDPAEEGEIGPTAAGVSDDPCPGARDEELGCLRLGVLADHGDAWGVRSSERQVAAQEAFWDRVNEAGGVGGHEVHLEIREVSAEPDEQVEVASELLDEVVALALLPGDATTAELAELLADREVPAALPGWWSGWHDAALQPGLLPPADHSRCLAATAGLDWYAQGVERPLAVLVVAHEGVGADDLAAAGERWTDATGVGWLGVAETGTVEDDADPQDAAAQAVMDRGPDVVLLATTPTATGEIVRKAAARGFEGTFLGTMGSWHPELLDDPEQAQALQALYRHLGPWVAPDEEAAGHAALLAAHEDDDEVTLAGVTGWMAAYPMLSALRAAAAAEELTRPGLYAALEGLEVDVEGTMPARRLGAEARPAPTVVAAPDAETPGGLRSEGEIDRGPHLDDLDHPEDCLA